MHDDILFFMKTCIKCGQTEEQTPFPKDKNQCKECLKQYKQRHYIKNKQKINAQQKEYYEINKNSVLEYQKIYYHSEAGKLNSMFNTAKKRAEKKNIEFNLTKEWISQQLEKQKYCCILTNIPLIFNETENYINPYAPSLDRIDSNQGYTKDNVRIVCAAINLSLNEFGEDTFRKICEAYINSITHNISADNISTLSD